MEHRIHRVVEAERLRDVVAEEAERRIPFEMGDIRLGAGQQVVRAQDVPPVGEQPLTQIGAEETSAAGDDRPPGRQRPTPR